ncbi:Hypothetical predicted protein [Octopus vulgaris]|uniref:Uncharacterized protein n=1 Tax=Octopus vulgaris TaxID=6645 RepID=A0AA36AMI6_OCTVU|nr:Hypothetical predicted protein [Octopus vulgaris]
MDIVENKRLVLETGYKSFKEGDLFISVFIFYVNYFNAVFSFDSTDGTHIRSITLPTDFKDAAKTALMKRSNIFRWKASPYRISVENQGLEAKRFRVVSNISFIKEYCPIEREYGLRDSQ